MIPLPSGSTVVHLPGRRALGIDPRGAAVDLGDGWVAAAAVLPVGHLRTLVPASEPVAGAPRLPLFGYTAIAEHDGELMVAATRTDRLGWWAPGRHRSAPLPRAVDGARRALPGNRLVDHLAVCAQELRCYTAQNTFMRRYEGALPASPACNADCLGCISLQTDGAVPAPQPRMGFAPTAAEIADLAGYFLRGAERGGRPAIVSFGQGCEGEPLTRGDILEEAVRRVRAAHPLATIHVNTNGSRADTMERLVRAGCNSVRVSAISFIDTVFRAYYRPVGYGLDDVLECGRVMSAAGGQVCLNLLTFPGITDTEQGLAALVAACRVMGVRQIQWRSLNVDHDWLSRLLAAAWDGGLLTAGVGLRAAIDRVRVELPEVAHGNFTRPVTTARQSA